MSNLKETFAAILQDLLHYAGTIWSSMGYQTPHDEYTFVGQAETIRERVDMYDRLVDKFSDMWCWAYDQKLITDTLNADEQRENLVIEPPKNEQEMLANTKLFFSWISRVAGDCGIDAFHGEVLA